MGVYRIPVSRASADGVAIGGVIQPDTSRLPVVTEILIVSRESIASENASFTLERVDPAIPGGQASVTPRPISTSMAAAVCNGVTGAPVDTDNTEPTAQADSDLLELTHNLRASMPTRFVARDGRGFEIPNVADSGLILICRSPSASYGTARAIFEVEE